jgi:hypothetical protein
MNISILVCMNISILVCMTDMMNDSCFQSCRNGNCMLVRQVSESDENYFAHRLADILMVIHAAIEELKKAHHLPCGSLTMF